MDQDRGNTLGPIRSGDVVVIIGGAPAGSGCAIRLLKQAHSRGIRPRVIIFEGKAFEAGVLERIGMPSAIAMRHRSPHFSHVFSGDGYSAGYYSYMWSEVMDADAYRAFEETGDPFDRATAARLAEFVYSAGGRQEPDDAYRAFRGAMPGVEALLEGRGLVDDAA